MVAKEYARGLLKIKGFTSRKPLMISTFGRYGGILFITRTTDSNNIEYTYLRYKHHHSGKF